MAEKLTPQQEQAVRDRGGRLLVSAAAGSGKTKVLVDRLMGYLTDPVSPANMDEFLIITYTKAAAAELRGKIAAKLTQRIAEEPENRHLQQQLQRLYLTQISTVHSFCSNLLREYAYRLDIPADFRMAEENECRELRERTVTQVLEHAYETAAGDPDFCAFIDTQGLGRDDRAVPEILFKVYDNARCHLDPEKWLSACVNNAEVSGCTDASETVWGRYLMDDLFRCLDDQILAMEECTRQLEQVAEMKKPVVVLRDNVRFLRQLRESATWDDIWTRRDLQFGSLYFPKKTQAVELVERVKAVRNSCKAAVAAKLRSFADSSQQVLQDLTQSGAAARGLVGLVKSFADGYARAKRSRRVLDFSDLEHLTLDLLVGKSRSGPTALAAETGSQFREVLVDEYQDSNAVQDAIFSALTDKKKNCFMVGDVKQSIYQFRLADPGIFLEKYERYQPADQAKPGQGRKVLLSSNFRSGGGVIAAVNDVFRANMSPRVGGLPYGEGEELREGVPHMPLPEPEVELHAITVQADTYAEEAAFAAERIAALLDGCHMVRRGDALRPIEPADIVILLRSPGSVGRVYQQALEQRGIPCTSGGGTDLLQTLEISTLQALLQTVSNPRQDIPLTAAMASPLFGFTANDLAAICGNNRQGSVYDAVCRFGSEKCAAFLQTLAYLRREARMNPLTKLLESVYAVTGIERIYAAMPGGELRTGNLQTFYQLASDFESAGRRDLDQFLEHLDMMAEKGLLSATEQGCSGSVTIMSIHKSKGLEFPVVLLCGLSREFNMESARAQVLCDRNLGLGLGCVDPRNRVRYPTISKRAIAVKTAADTLSEELRVLYVAMTRARDRLIMTYAAKTLPKDLQDFALRMDVGSRELLTADVVCPGEWVLLAALRHTEAGELFRIGAKPAQTSLGTPPWKITAPEEVVAEAVSLSAGEAERTMPADTVERLTQSLRFSYGHTAATRQASKLTATQLKGRVKDQEAAEEAQPPAARIHSWRRASFAGEAPRGKAYGSAIHSALQYISYEACTDEAAVKQEIQRLTTKGYITAEQGGLVNCPKLAKLFGTELGKKLRTGNVIREFKFSILDDAGQYGDGLDGEQVLLQGVVDCALLEDDGITVIDFKTDFVTEETLPLVTERYRSQVTAYAQALRRIYKLPIKAQYLYFFHLDRFISL